MRVHTCACVHTPMLSIRVWLFARTCLRVHLCIVLSLRFHWHALGLQLLNVCVCVRVQRFWKYARVFSSSTSTDPLKTMKTEGLSAQDHRSKLQSRHPKPNEDPSSKTLTGGMTRMTPTETRTKARGPSWHADPIFALPGSSSWMSVWSWFRTLL